MVAALLLGLFDCGTTTQLHSCKLLEKDDKFWEELVLQWHPWDLLTVVPFPAEVGYHSKLSGSLQRALETAVSTNFEDKI